MLYIQREVPLKTRMQVHAGIPVQIIIAGLNFRLQPALSMLKSDAGAPMVLSEELMQHFGKMMV